MLYDQNFSHDITRTKALLLLLLYRTQHMYYHIIAFFLCKNKGKKRCQSHLPPPLPFFVLPFLCFFFVSYFSYSTRIFLLIFIAYQKIRYVLP